ncbi:DUF5431 family protein [Cronobacter malonaticus]|uniref:DUF5431 family protein n=1 Tax=Cronobacter malonaticus TaxID=413503 RepID=UPI0035197300
MKLPRSTLFWCVLTFQLTNEAICMLEQHQDSLLPAVKQGEEGHETAAKHSVLVRINRMFNAVDIHIPDA